jgi:hypothetical protein
MISQIIVHLLPHEIDWFEWQCKQLKIGSAYVEDKVIMDVTLNLNLIDWRASHLPKQYFIDKFNQLKQYFDWCESIFEINDDNTCLGIDDKRRTSIRKYSPDNFVYLDCDIIFTPETLAILMNGAKAIKDKYYIISPQISKLWDYTWDVISSEHYKNEDYGFEKIIDPFSLLNTSYGDISLIPLNVFKFGGGWFNVISADLLKLTDIPDSFGPYGIDDTYVMYCCEIMKHMNPKQYVMNNLLVAENYKYRNNPYTNYLSIIDKKEEFRKKAEINFQTELNKFHEKIYSNNNN